MGTITDWFKRITNQGAGDAFTVSTRDRLASALGQSHGGERDIYNVYGYPDKPSFHLLYQYATRQGMAHRIVRGVPKSCWSDGFKIYTDDDLKTEILED
jgi:predicted DsbA family dithiol-disulfide isomerase